MRTLIVEDDVTSRDLLKSFLAPCSECHVAVNGREGVAAFRAARERAEPYDLICMDIMMPEMDGQTALKEIRAIEQVEGTPSTGRTKVIMTTALNDVESVVQSIQANGDAYLVKPIHKKDLLAHLHDLQLL